MSKSAKIAISLPEEVLDGVDRERIARGMSRSEFFRHAIGVFLHNEQEKKAVEEYIRGYLEDPETDGELGWVESASHEVLADYPWHNKNE